MTNPMWKTTIVIWTDYNPANAEIEDLARDATSGDAYCSKSEIAAVEDVTTDPDWVETDFFGSIDDDERAAL